MPSENILGSWPHRSWTNILRSCVPLSGAEPVVVLVTAAPARWHCGTAHHRPRRPRVRPRNVPGLPTRVPGLLVSVPGPPAPRPESVLPTSQLCPPNVSGSPVHVPSLPTHGPGHSRVCPPDVRGSPANVPGPRWPDTAVDRDMHQGNRALLRAPLTGSPQTLLLNLGIEGTLGATRVPGLGRRGTRPQTVTCPSRPPGSQGLGGGLAEHRGLWGHPLHTSRDPGADRSPERDRSGPGAETVAAARWQP